MDKQEIYEILNEAYFSENCHEKNVLENLPRLAIDGGVFVDIGASLGQFSKYAAEHLKQSQIISLEADPVRFEELERNCAKWSADYGTPIKVVHAALSNEDAEQTTFYTTNSNVSGGLYSHAVGQEVDWQPVSIPAITLDSLFPADPPDLVKVDIEGGEYKMLLGAGKILEKGKTVFLIELHSWSDADSINPEVESRKIFEKYGYHSVALYDKYIFLPKGMPLIREKLLSPLRKISHSFQTKNDN